MRRAMKRGMLCVTLTGLLAGCAAQQAWVRSDGSAGDFEKDRQACEAAAEGDAYGQKTVNSKIFERCLTEKGWTRK